MSIIGGGWPAVATTPEANPHLYVHNVPKDSNEDELRSVFGQYGTVANVRLKVNQKVGPHAVYAFVTFNSTEEARNALVNLQGKELRGRSLRIEFQRAATAAAAAAGAVAGGSPRNNFSVLRVAGTQEPPAKRSRLDVAPPEVRYVASNDQTGLIEALKQMLALTRPDLSESFAQFCEQWGESESAALKGRAASSGPTEAPARVRMWPASQLSSMQQRLASEGNLELDQETGRWGVLLNKLLHAAPTEPPPPRVVMPTPAPTSLEAVWLEKLGTLVPCAGLTVWRGTMNRNEKRVVSVTLQMLAGELPPILLSAPVLLSITLRSPYEEMLKKSFLGVARLDPATPEAAQQLEDYVAYFETKNRAGVAKLTDVVYAYIFPTSAFSSASRTAVTVVFAKSNE